MSSKFRSIRQLRFLFVLALFAGSLFLQYPRSEALRMHGIGHASHPLLVGYFPQWGLYYDHPYYVKTLADNGGVGRLDQINYAQGFVTNGRCSVADPNADLNTTYTGANSVNGKPDNPASPFRGYFHQLRELKRKYPKLKILISLEGNPADFAKDAAPENREAFVASCVETFVRGNFGAGIHEPGIFDGFDIDWEYPKEPDAANFQALLKEFRRQMAEPGQTGQFSGAMRLSIAVGHAPQMQPGTDFAVVSTLVDQVAVMNYDYVGPWSQKTGFLAPLFASAADPRHSNSVEQDMASYQQAGVPAAKLLMGLPFYGYGWSGVDKTNNGVYQAGHGVRGDFPYSYLRGLNTSFTAYRDQRSQAPWLYDGQTFWTYEDAVSIRYKASYAANKHLGGVMIWELSNDSADGELLGAAYHSLRHPLEARVFEKAAVADVPSAQLQQKGPENASGIGTH